MGGAQRICTNFFEIKQLGRETDWKNDEGEEEKSYGIFNLNMKVLCNCMYLGKNIKMKKPHFKQFQP